MTRPGLKKFKDARLAILAIFVRSVIDNGKLVFLALDYDSASSLLQSYSEATHIFLKSSGGSEPRRGSANLICWAGDAPSALHRREKRLQEKSSKQSPDVVLPDASQVIAHSDEETGSKRKAAAAKKGPKIHRSTGLQCTCEAFIRSFERPIIVNARPRTEAEIIYRRLCLLAPALSDAKSVVIVGRTHSVDDVRYTRSTPFFCLFVIQCFCFFDADCRWASA